MVAFSKQVAIHFAHPFTTEGPGIVLFVNDAASFDSDPVVQARVLADLCLKHPGVVRRGHGDLFASHQQGHALGLWHPHPHGPTLI